MIESGSLDNDDITYINPTETKTYSSIDELIKSENLEILYPSWLPGNEKIVTIWYLVEDGSKGYMLQCSTPEHSINIEPGIDLPEELKSNCIEKETSDYLVYYEKTPLYLQANFIYKNNRYSIKSDTEDNLFRIIENLKEIS